MDTSTWQPTTQACIDALIDQNPWRSLGRVPDPFYKPVRRFLASHLWRALLGKSNRFQVVLGPRRVGKSVTLYQTVQSLIEDGVDPRHVWYMRMDHPLLMTYDLGTWVKAIVGEQQTTQYLLLDEINYAKQWDRWLKTFFDEQLPVKIVATSSSTAALRDGFESGIGRWSEQFLTPYTFSEFLSLRQSFTCTDIAGSPNLFETIATFVANCPTYDALESDRRRYLLIGGFPELLLAHEQTEDVKNALLRSQQTLRSEAVQRVAGMDLPQVFNIQNPILLEKLIYLLGQRMCGLSNVSNLASTLEITRPTVQQYIEYLEKAFLVFNLPNYSPKEDAIQRRGRKVFFVDGAVRNAALQRGLAPADDPHEMGLLVENAAAAHLYTLSLQNGVRIFHWRDSTQAEVDLIYDDTSAPIAFEITTLRDHDLSGLRALMQKYPRFKGRCFLVSSHSNSSHHARMPSGSADGVGRISFDAFLMAVSAQVRAALGLRLETAL